jgi:hypothetical protein
VFEGGTQEMEEEVSEGREKCRKEDKDRIRERKED